LAAISGRATGSTAQSRASPLPRCRGQARSHEICLSSDFHANYVRRDAELVVRSSGATAVTIASSTGHAGTTDYRQNLAFDSQVVLIAPLIAASGTARFVAWQGCDATSGRRDDLHAAHK